MKTWKTRSLHWHVDNMFAFIRKKWLRSHIAEVLLVFFHSLQLWWIRNCSRLFNLSSVFYLWRINMNFNKQQNSLQPNTNRGQASKLTLFFYILFPTVDVCQPFSSNLHLASDSSALASTVCWLCFLKMIFNKYFSLQYQNWLQRPWLNVIKIQGEDTVMKSLQGISLPVQ